MEVRRSLGETISANSEAPKADADFVCTQPCDATIELVIVVGLSATPNCVVAVLSSVRGHPSNLGVPTTALISKMTSLLNKVYYQKATVSSMLGREFVRLATSPLCGRVVGLRGMFL